MADDAPIRTTTVSNYNSQTLMPHSGTKSRLLNTTTRSQTVPLLDPAADPSREYPELGPTPRSRRHFRSAPVYIRSQILFITMLLSQPYA